MAFKITFIGAGSIGFTRNLLSDLLSVPAFRNIQVAFTDISAHNLEMVTKLCQRDIDHNGLDIKIHATADRKEALRGAKYVINCVRIGGLEAFETDVEIPLKYGVDQCVGDTLCAGGIMYGQRGIAAMLEFCRDIREVASADCLLLNYANPNAMVTWACNQYGKVPTIGLCHGVIHGQEQIAEVLGYKKEELDFICAGINHQTWYISVKHRGEELADRLPEAFASHERFSKEEKVRIDMLQNFGYYSTESNGHLSEYVSWYRKDPEKIPGWIDLGSWINGETGGYLRICREGRNWFEHDFPNWMKEPPREYRYEARGLEHCSYIIEGLETGKVYRGHFNVVNRGCITNLPDDAVVEVPGYVDGNGVNIPRVGNLPLGCAAVCNQSISVQRLAVEAAVHGDIKLLRQAMLLDPLTGAVCSPAEIFQMTDEMLVACKSWLPQYAKEISLAEKRLEHPQVKTSPFAGAARLREKTVAEMERDRIKTNRLVADSDKAGDLHTRAPE